MNNGKGRGMGVEPTLSDPKKRQGFLRNKASVDNAIGQPEEVMEDTPLFSHKHRNKHRLWIGIVAFVILILGMFFENSYTSSDVDGARSSGIGKGMNAGALLTTSDELMSIDARDFEIEMKPDLETTRMLIWDFAAEDGDVVTVKVDGNIRFTNVNILNRPIVLDIPIPSVVEIVGVRDGGGGITYGVKLPGAALKNVYFNVAPEGGSNQYKLF